MNIYVGNLPRTITEAALRSLFEAFGEVASAKVIKDRFTNEVRGFGFVEMPNSEEATAAITGMNGREYEGQRLRVNEAHSPEDRPARPRTGSGPRGPRREGGFGGPRREGGFGGPRRDRDGGFGGRGGNGNGFGSGSGTW